MNVQLVVLFMIFMISILMTTLLSGKFHYCDLEHTSLLHSQKLSLIETKWDCLNYGGMWRPSLLNFDDTVQGLLTLFIF